jgi:hypothetical protein
MNRRDLLKTFGATAGALVAGVGLTRKYGYVDVEIHRQYQARGVDLEVWHNGRNVTFACREADDRAGFAVLLCHDLTAHRDLDCKDPAHFRPGRHDELCTIRLEGPITIRPKGTV